MLTNSLEEITTTEEDIFCGKDDNFLVLDICLSLGCCNKLP
jgi:hypothetical protein